MRETLVVLASVSSGDHGARCGAGRYRNRTNQREARGDFSPSPPSRSPSCYPASSRDGGKK